jgi:hypothetical protein
LAYSIKNCVGSFDNLRKDSGVDNRNHDKSYKPH